MFRTHSGARIRALSAALTLSLVAACRPAAEDTQALTPASGKVAARASRAASSNAAILEWNAALFQAMKTHDGHKHSLAAARALALMHLAQHDAVNAVAPAYESYLFASRDASADPTAAAAAAAHAVLSATFPRQAATFDDRLARATQELAEPGRSRGLELGKRAARALLEQRRHDGSDTPALGDYRPRSGSGAYQFVPPFDLAFAPGWRAVAPFALKTPAQFRPGPPPALNSVEYTAAFEEVKTTGGAVSKARTPEQTAYAKYWWEFSEIGWNRITAVVANDRKLDLAAAARLFALVNMAISDAYVAGWDAKFHYDFWRPTTAIRAAESDGNPLTAADPQWTAAELVPPVQDYPSTHSALGDAAAEVLADVLGDATAFTVGSSTAPPEVPLRSFPSFSAAADENADSRVRAGLHFRFSCREGQRLGRQIGRYTVDTRLRPL